MSRGPEAPPNGTSGDPARELRGGPGLYRRIVETSTEGIWVIDAESRTTYVNATMARMLGRTVDEMMGAPLFDFMDEEGREIARANVERRRAGIAERHEFKFLRADGSELWTLIATNPIRDEGGRYLGALGMVSDITERRRAEQALRDTERRYRELVQHAPTAIYEVDFRTRRLISVNDAMCRMLGYTREELLAMDPFAILDEQGRQLFEERVQSWLAGRAPDRVAEYRVRTADGREIHALLDATFTVDEHGRPAGATVVAHDITEHKRAEEELRRSRDQLQELALTLEQRVWERTGEVERGLEQLRQLHAQLSRAEQRERRRLAVMLHDGLQQLLVAGQIRVTLARAAAGEGAAPMLDEVHQLLGQCIEAARSLTVQLSPPLLHDRGLVPALHWLAREMGDKQRLQVEVDAAGSPEPLPEDVRLLLFQAARELLFNVAKHARAERAMVRVERDDALLTLEVADRGRGFDPRATTSPENGGATFGLLSVRQRVEWLGGTMHVDSVPDRGTRVLLSVPVGTSGSTGVESAGAGRDRIDPQAPLADDGGPIRVLLADDHAVVRDGLASLLGQHPDMQVVAQARDGVEAIELAREHAPDVIVMDLSMPRLDGVEATRRITAEHPRVRVIGLSMHDSADVAEAMREAGAVGYVRKGGPIDDLIALVRDAGRTSPAAPGGAAGSD